MTELSKDPQKHIEGLRTLSKEVEEASTQTQDLARATRRKTQFVVVGCIAYSVLWTAIGVACITMVIKRPVPQDRVYVSVMTTDGISLPQLRDDLSPSVRARVLKGTIQRYVTERETYSWESENAHYLAASQMSTPAEAERLKKFTTTDPKRPEALYGIGNDAGTAEVSNFVISTDESVSNSAVVYFDLLVNMPRKPPVTLRKLARVSFMDAQGQMDPLVQQALSPLGFAFSHYEPSILGMK